jgi:hypothetical protein
MLALLIITILTDELVCMLLLKVKADISKFWMFKTEKSTVKLRLIFFLKIWDWWLFQYFLGEAERSDEKLPSEYQATGQELDLWFPEYGMKVLTP